MTVEVVSWWMLDLARQAAGDKFYVIIASPAEMLLKLYWWDSSKFRSCSDIDTYIFGSV